MMIKQIFIFFYFIHSIFSLDKFLQFIPHKEVNDRKSVHELDLLDINIDAFHKNQILIKYIQHIGDWNIPKINFYCHVKTLDGNFKIHSAFLCKIDSIRSNEYCQSLLKDTQQIKFDKAMEFEVKFDSAIGVTAILNMDIKTVLSRQKPFDGFYYCKLNNLLGSISSNYIEIQDYEFYKKKSSKLITAITKNLEPTSINEFKSDSFPIYLNCGKPLGNLELNLPKWVIKDLITSFRWSFCPNINNGPECFKTVLDIESKKSRTINDFMDYYQYPNGTAMIMGIKSNEYLPSGLVCSSRSKPPAPYVIYLFKNGSKWEPISYLQSDKFSKNIQKLSPAVVNVDIREGIYVLSRFKLYASYVANPDPTQVTFEWTFNGYSVPLTFEPRSYQLIFPSEITEINSGRYELRVSQSEPFHTVIFTYMVSVVSAPKLKNNVKYPPVIYQTVDKSVHLDVAFEKNITKMSIEINGIKMYIRDQYEAQSSMIILSSKFPFLEGIQMNSNFYNREGGIAYSVLNLYRGKNSTHSKSHTVTFVAENGVGVSKVSYLIRVLDSPTFINYLNDFNCTNNCWNDQKHIFKCAIDAKEYLAEGCNIKYIWALNEATLNSMTEAYDQKSYFKINNSEITLNPIKSDNDARDKRMIETLQDSTLSCQIIIYHPVTPGSDLLVKLYNSNDKLILKSLLETKINLQVKLVDIASTSWILPLIITLIVIVIFVVMILYFCLRGSGETYNVDQNERAYGHDPDKEIRDEIFQPYERDDETNFIQPSHLSFNDDDSVGVGSDDGELDVYDIDPGKFNEEGSFIGQNASDPRKNKINHTQ